MTVYVVFTREKTRRQSEMDAYAASVRPTLEGHPVTPLAAYGKFEVLEGPQIEGAVILQFPTAEDAKAWYNSPAYQKVVEHRHLGADYRSFIVEGV